MEWNLSETEKIEDLQCKGYKLIQNKESFCYGIDSVLLSHFAKEMKKGSKVADLGTGNGVIGILLCAKTELANIVGIEVQQESYELAKKNIQYNKLEERFQVIQGNIKEIKQLLPRESMDVVVSNPPYKKASTGLTNGNPSKTIARHEITATLDDFFQATSYLLKDKGVFYLVHRPDRLVDIFESAHKYHLEPKNMQLVYPKIDRQPNLVLLKMVKNARTELRIDKPLIIYSQDGDYSEEIKEIYENQKGVM